jgi:hypothetical protein
MTVSLARRLTWEGVVAPEDSNDALYRHVTERISFLQGLVERHPEMAERLELELGHPSDRAAAPIESDPALLARLPPGLTISLAALPVRRDPTTGVVHVLAAHPTDAHLASELSFHLESPVEVSGAPLTAILAALAGSSSSEPPIPLVRRNLEPSPPSTARHGSLAPPSPVAPGTRATSLAPMPIIALTGTRPTGTPSLPATSNDASSAPSPKESLPPAALLESELSALDDLAQAATPEEVVAALVAGLASVAATVVVLAARGKNFEGRDTNDARIRQAVRVLTIPIDRPSILQTAVQSMGYVGPVPQTPIHEELASILGNPEGEVAVGAVMVTGRAALVYVMTGLTTTYLATRRGDKLGDAAGKALARIVRGRKK